MAEQKRNLVDRNAGEQHFDRKSVAEHVRVAALSLAVRPPDVGQLEQAAIASLQVGHRTLRLSVAAPEEVAGIGFRARRKILEGLDQVGRKWNIGWRSRFRLVEEKTVTLDAVAFERDGVADAQSTLAHQQGHGAKPGSKVFERNESAARIPIEGDCVEDILELISGKVVGWNVYDFDLSESQDRVFFDVTASHAGPEKADDPILFFLAGQRCILPCAPEAA